MIIKTVKVSDKGQIAIPLEIRREAGIEGIHEFSETKTVYIDYSGKLQKTQGIK